MKRGAMPGATTFTEKDDAIFVQAKATGGAWVQDQMAAPANRTAHYRGESNARLFGQMKKLLNTTTTNEVVHFPITVTLG